MTLELLESSGLGTFIKSIFCTGIIKTHGKKRSGVLVYGPPNIGKSTVVNMLRNIFICDNYIIGKTRYAVGRVVQRYLP